MSKTSNQIRYDSLILLRDTGTPSQVLYIDKASWEIQNIIKNNLQSTNEWQTGSEVDIDMEYQLDLFEEIINYHLSNLHIPGGGGSGGSCSQPWDPSKAGGYTDPCMAIYSFFYVAPNVSCNNNVGTVEIGSVVDNVTVNWSVTGSGAITSQNLTGVGAVPVGITTNTFTSLGLIANKSWTISATDDAGGSDSCTTSVRFSFRRFWGTSSDVALTNPSSLVSSEFASGRTKNWSQNGNGEYLYYSYPASWGVANPPSIINGLNNTAWIQTTVSYTNPFGHTENYYVFRSTFIQNGSGIAIKWL